MGNKFIISGDQNPSWDAIIKLIALKNLGVRVRHSVHTADRFSRPPAGQNIITVSNESIDSKGNPLRWTASLEGAMFMGRMPLDPRSFVECGIDVKAAAQARGVDTDRYLRGISESDWVGLALPESQARRAAHGLPVREILGEFPRLRKPLRTNLLETLRAPEHKAAELVFGRFWDFNRYERESWERATQAILRQGLDHAGVNGEVRLTTSVDEFPQPSRLFELFVGRYTDCRDAYNIAVKSGSEDITPLTEGQLPFYAIMRERGSFVRVDLEYRNGDRPRQVLERAAGEHGEVVAVLGKAVTHFVELLMEGDLVLPEGGSVYWPQSVRFIAELRERGISFDLHRFLVLRLHALDALTDVTTEFRLPPYLAEAMGVDWIRGAEFAGTWRKLVAGAKQRLIDLSGKMTPELVQTLGEHELIGDDAVKLVSSLQWQLSEHNRRSAEAFESAKEPNLDKDEKARRHQAALARRAELVQSMAPDVFRSALAATLAAVDAKRADLFRTLMAVSKLGYWDNRPFAHWVLSLPGWLDGIIRRAELVEQPLVPPNANG